jgi:ribonuclease VapC
VIVDTSALIAVLKNEPDAADIIDQLFDPAKINRISAANYLEAAIVIDAVGDATLSQRLDDLLAEASIQIETVTEAQVKRARAAYRLYGKGSGHAAQLNFGDCFAYALATDTDEPLLFKGNDFCHTDVQSSRRV